nr:hypothetical protein [Tanacetum cinerariifolium]
MDTRKNIVDLEAFREMLHISHRVLGQSFAELPFEEEILEFLRFLGHSAQIKTLTDSQVISSTNFMGAISQKKRRLCLSNLKPSIPRRNKVNWHYVRDDILFSTIKVVSRHQNTQQYGVILPIELTTEDIRNTKAYKEYYACATGEAAPKPKASARRKRGGSDSSTTPPTAVASPRPIIIDDDDNDEDDEEEIAKLDEQEDIESGEGDAEETESDGEISQDIEDSHVTLNPVQPNGQQESSLVSSFVTSMPNLTTDAGMESIFTTASSPIAPLPTPTPIMTPSTIATITTTSEAPIPPTTFPSAAKSQVKEQVSSILPRIKEFVNAQLEAEVLTRSSNSSRTSYAVEADLTEMELKKILIEKMEGNKSIQRSDEQRNLYKALVDAYEADKTILESYGDTSILKRRRGEHESASTLSEPATRSASRKPSTPDRDWNKTLPAIQGSTQTWISELAKQADSRSSFNELLDTPIDFSNFIMNRLGVDTLTLELLAGPTYELMKGSCTNLAELEYHLEEVYKATTNQLDWVNPEGQQYPHNLLQPLPLIPNNRGRRVIPFVHFINNNLEYIRGGTSSQKYTTSVIKTKAADYGHIKWIEDLVPRTMWIQEPLNYDKHALWGVFHWGWKRQ